MTITTPTPGNDTGLPEYLKDMQGRACRLSGVMNAIAYLENEGACTEGRMALTFLAEELATDLYNALDTVNIPNGEIK